MNVSSMNEIYYWFIYFIDYCRFCSQNLAFIVALKKNTFKVCVQQYTYATYGYSVKLVMIALMIIISQNYKLK